MNKAPAETSTRWRIAQRFRWTLLTLGIATLITAGFVFLDQTQNQLIVINQTAEPFRYDVPMFVGKRAVPGKSMEFVPVSPPLNVAPYSTRRIILPNNNLMWAAGGKESFSKLESWGVRITRFEARTPASPLNFSSSPLRQWVNARRGWLPLPASWMD